MSILKLDAAGTNVVFNVEQNSQGIVLSSISKDATIKVDLVSKNQNDINRLPEMTVIKAASISKAIAQNSWAVELLADDMLADVGILFSADGVLPLDDDTYYKVTISETPAKFVVENLNSSRLGTPIIVQKAEVRKTLTEKSENYELIDLLVFDDKLPTHFSYRVQDSTGTNEVSRKVEIDLNQMELHTATYKGEWLNADGKLENGLKEVVVMPIDQLDDVTFHQDISDGRDLLYYTVDFSAEV